MEEAREYIPVIDTHLHLWDVNRLEYPWLRDVPAIEKTFLIADYQEASKNFPVEKMVFVQCECRPEQCLQEVALVMEQADRDERIKGIVAYAPLEQGRAVTALLDAYRNNPLIKGVRRIYDDEPGLCDSSSFLDALNLLPSYNLSCDISIKPHSMPATIRMIKACPDTFFVLDHLGKPAIKNGGLATFQKDMDMLAALPNVVAKVSGLITEADWSYWTVEDLKPYIEHATTTFGFDRLVFGGDWPVVLLAGSYQQWLQALNEALSFASREELWQLFYHNAVKFYRL
jgi:L-fuconolactonase